MEGIFDVAYKSILTEEEAQKNEKVKNKKNVNVLGSSQHVTE